MVLEEDQLVPDIQRPVKRDGHTRAKWYNPSAHVWNWRGQKKKETNQGEKKR